MPDETLISVTETEVIEMIETEPEAINETTTTAITEEPALVQSVKNIETMMFYFLGITIVIIACFICKVIINVFFKGV